MAAKSKPIAAVLSEKKATRKSRGAGDRVVKSPKDFALDADVAEMLKRRAIASMTASAPKP